ADRNRVLAVLVRNHFGFLVKAADTQNRGLRLVDDRGAELFAEDTRIGEGERTAARLIRSQLLIASAVRQVDDGARHSEEVTLLALLDDRDDQAPIQRDGDANVDVLVVLNRIA